VTDVPRQIRQALTTQYILTHALRPRYQPILDRLTQEQDALDGYATTASGSDKGRSGKSTSSRTENNALDRLEGRISPTHALEEGLDLALTAVLIMRLLHTWCDTHSTQLTPTDLNRLRCLNWRKDDHNSCGNIATPRRHNNTTIDDGRCLDCGKEADRLNDQRADESNARRHRRYATRTTPAGDN